MTGAITTDLLLEEIARACGGGTAENEPEDEAEFLRGFLPIARHVRALDPTAKMVIGDKGAGKTHLFQALKFDGGRRALSDLADRHGHRILPLDRADWRVGFELRGTRFPAPEVLDQFAADRTVNEVRRMWLGLLLRVLVLEGDLDAAQLPTGLAQRAEDARSRLADLVGQLDVPGVFDDVFAALDTLDTDLKEADRHLVVTYDELDRVSPGDWAVVERVLQGLVQFWTAHSRRYRRIQPKIFLRRDLYERAALQGPDIAKVSWNAAELLWTPGDLYAMLFKRLANASPDVNAFLHQHGWNPDSDESLGLLPRSHDETSFSRPVAAVFSKYMGPDPRKGLTLRWIPNHLKDGHGRVVPRPLLRLVEHAARLERQYRRAERGHLIHHTALRGALDDVSTYRVRELAQEEFPWMTRVQEAFAARPIRVPSPRNDVIRTLRIDWREQPARPPETAPEALLDYLVELGIASVRSDGRIDIGDLYLKGLGLKRKGGVKRPTRLRAS